MKSKLQKQQEAQARQLVYNALSQSEKAKRLVPGGSTRQFKKLAEGKLI